MIGIVVTTAPQTAAKLRAALLVNKVGCAESNFVSFDSAYEAATTANPPVDLVFVVIDGAHQEPALQLIRRLRVAITAKVIAVGPIQNPKRVLQSIHAGAADYLEDGQQLCEELGELLHRLQREANQLAEPGRVVSVLAGDGGVGCSVVAANLAAVFAKDQRRSAVIDLNLRHGDQAVLFNLKPQHNLADLCRSIRTLDQFMLEQSLALHASGVSLVASPASSGKTVASIDPLAVRQIIQWSRLAYPFVIVDIDSANNDAALPIVAVSDLVLVVFRLDFVSLLHAHRLLQTLREAQIDPQKIHLLGNRQGQAGGLTLRNAEEALGRKIDFALPEDSASVLPAVNLGNPTALESPTSRFAKAVKKVAASLELSASQLLKSAPKPS